MPHAISRFLTALFASLLLFGGAAFAAPTTPTTDFTDNKDGTVTHKITGLTWKRCAEGMAWTGSTCSGTAQTYTWAQATALTSTFAGKDDWRLPTIAELVTIVERDAYIPAINGTVFPNTSSSLLFLSASTDAGDSSNAWDVDFGSGRDNIHSKTYSLQVRLVRGGQIFDPWDSSAYTPTSDFTDHSNGTVTHNKTSLTWKRCAEGQTWSGAICTGTAANYTWANATALTLNFAGYSDWRLPTKNELQTIVEWSTTNPAINPTLFPNIPLDNFFWSASAYAGDSSLAGGVDFGVGHYAVGNKTDSWQVRLVRGRQSIGTSTPAISLNGLSLNCPSTLTAGASGTCSATASYSDGTSKAVSPTWSSSNATTLTIGSGGSLTAGHPGTDATVTVSASYTENGTTKTASQTVTVKAALAALTGLSATCPSTINAGASAACSATASYSDGASRVVNATWTSSNTSVATVNGLTVMANAALTTDTPVSLNASYAENGVTQTATAMVTVKAAVPLTTSACSGSDRNLSAITIVGDTTKRPGDTLEVNYCLKNFNSATKFDIYVAVQLPDRKTLFFLQVAGFFQTPSYTTQVAPYLANTLIPDKSGSVLSLSVLPLTLPTGTYTFYAIPVRAGDDVMNFTTHVGIVAKEQVNLIE